jgi:hypothetical protein
MRGRIPLAQDHASRDNLPAYAPPPVEARSNHAKLLAKARAHQTHSESLVVCFQVSDSLGSTQPETNFPLTRAEAHLSTVKLLMRTMRGHIPLAWNCLCTSIHTSGDKLSAYTLKIT